MSEKGRPLPKFGEWDVNDPASAEGFTVIFNKARDEKKTGGKPESPSKTEAVAKHGTVDPVKPQAVSCFLHPFVYLLIFNVTVSISANIGNGCFLHPKNFRYRISGSTYMMVNRALLTLLPLPIMIVSLPQTSVFVRLLSFLSYVTFRDKSYINCIIYLLNYLAVPALRVEECMETILVFLKTLFP